MSMDACPECQTPISATKVVKGEDGAVPSDGDVTLCGKCAALFFYVDSGKGLRVAPPSEIAELDKQFPGFADAIDRARWMIQRFHGIG